MFKILGIWIILLLMSAACAAADSSPIDQPQQIQEVPSTSPVPTIESEVTIKEIQVAPMTPSPIPTHSASSTPDNRINTYSADDQRIRYIGRFDFSDPKSPAFDWSASAVEFSFSGTSLAIMLEDGRNYYNVHIDNQPVVLKSEPGHTRYLVADNLDPGEHHARIAKRTEAYVGAAEFQGLEVSGGELLSLPPRRARRIEFVGDSITAGYGNEGDAPECWFTPQTENAELSYAAMTAADLDAEYSLIALSGLGVVRNLREEDAASSSTAINFIGRTLGMNPSVRWPSDLSAPSAVVLNLGTNDFSSIPFPEETEFVAAYIELLRALRARSPQAALFAVAGPLMLDPAPRLIQTAVEQFIALDGDEQTIFVLIEDNLERSAADFGCDWHPNVNGQRKIAAQLVPFMARELGWQVLPK